VLRVQELQVLRTLRQEWRHMLGVQMRGSVQALAAFGFGWHCHGGFQRGASGAEPGSDVAELWRTTVLTRGWLSV
jgi:hypothetical protein